MNLLARLAQPSREFHPGVALACYRLADLGFCGKTHSSPAWEKTTPWSRKLRSRASARRARSSPVSVCKASYNARVCGCGRPSAPNISS